MKKNISPTVEQLFRPTPILFSYKSYTSKSNLNYPLTNKGIAFFTDFQHLLTDLFKLSISKRFCSIFDFADAHILKQ